MDGTVVLNQPINTLQFKISSIFWKVETNQMMVDVDLYLDSNASTALAEKVFHIPLDGLPVFADFASGVKSLIKQQIESDGQFTVNI